MPPTEIKPTRYVPSSKPEPDEDEDDDELDDLPAWAVVACILALLFVLAVTVWILLS